MSTELAWLEQFTGVNITDPDNEEKTKTLADDAAKGAGAAEAFEKRRAKQAEHLASVRKRLDGIKAGVQKVMSQKIPSGPFKGKSFLDIQRGQVKEIDVDEVLKAKGKGGSSAIPNDIINAIIQAGVKIGDLGRELREAKLEGGAPPELFTTPELIAEFWTPVMRERIVPDGVIANPFSETQQMLDATNQLYLDMVEEKKLRGELTPERDLFRDSVELVGDLASVVGSGLSEFSGDEIELASEILTTTSEVIGGLTEVYDMVKASDYANAASSALDIAGKLTASILGQAGVGDQAVAAVSGAFTTGSSAVLMGKAFIKYRNGEANLSEALTVMGTTLSSALATAGEIAGGEAAVGLKIAAKAAPAAFKALGLASDLPTLLRPSNGKVDFAAVVTVLGQITKDVLASIPGLEGKADDLDSVVDLSVAGLNMTIQVAINLKKGEYVAALNGVIADIGDNLGSLLSTVGVDEGVANQVVGIYKGSASATKALQMLACNPPKVTEALGELTGGLKSALDGTGDPVLKQIGGGLDLAVKQLVTVKDLKSLYDEGKYDEAIAFFEGKIEKGVDDWDKLFSSSDEDEDDEEEDDQAGNDSGEGGPVGQGQKPPTGKPDATQSLAALVKELKTGDKPDPAKMQQAIETMKAVQKAEQEKADVEEARMLLAEVELDLKSLSEAEKTGAEASNIDALIGELLRDRMILKLATQIAQGGAAFLAKFVPGLGAVSAGIKLAASLVAVAQRAKQVDAWLKTQSDLQAAQSALSSSAGNFVKNQGTQLAHYSAQAFFAAAQLAGEITKLTGMAAGIGEAISSIATAGAKAEEILMKQKNKADIEKAWKITAESLRNPGNRKLGLKARALNPSLAKFSIAWGAMILKDPLARNAFRACGLTEASLNDENADVNKVVQYLEVFYEDDPTLYRDATVQPPDWMPQDLEVDLESWAKLKRLAGSKGGVSINQSGALEGLLADYLAVQEDVETTSETLEQAQTAFSTTRNLLRTTMATVDSTGTAPKTPAPTQLPPTDDLERAIEAHAAALRARKSALDAIVSALGGCQPVMAVPKNDGSDDKNPNRMAVVDALARMQSQASRTGKAAELDEQGLAESQMELKTAVADMQRRIDEAQRQQTETVV